MGLSIINMFGGGVGEDIEQALSRVAANIQDPNTEAKAVREVTVKLIIKPKEDRATADIRVKVEDKLAPKKAMEGFVFLGENRDGEAWISEHNLNQMALFDELAPKPDLPDNVKALGVRQ